MAYAAISKPSLHQNTVLYTGNASTQSITGVGFQPDWTWIKSRTGTHDTENSGVFDAVRGATKRLMSNSNDIEYTTANSLTAFDADGFSLGDYNQQNGTGTTYASWNWKANGAGSLNEVGSIDSTVSVNTTAGFSIAKWVGTGTGTPTIGHGLGKTPGMIIVKRLSGGTTNWVCFHQSLGANGVMALNATDAIQTISGYWGTPDSTTFGTLGAYDNNISGANYIGYCFADIAGYSKFSSYLGNGSSTDGTFVYTGFKPSFIMRKNTDGGVTESWIMEDNKRSTSNVATAYLEADTSDAEGSSYDTDFLSNGFKMRSNNDGTNRSGATYIYMAFAAEPLVANVGSGIPATAR